MWLLKRMSRVVNRRCYSTIFALSSGQGKCGIAVIRVSGKGASEALMRMTPRKLLPAPRRAVITAILDSITREQVDRGLVLWFPGPNSFTGEDCCEFHVHGGPAVVEVMLRSLSSLQNYRPAVPGEFTKRAFLAGKMDLTKVEGLADLIHAETQQQRKQALLQMEGSLANLYGGWRQHLVKTVANVEAYIDFSEEENIESNVLDDARLSMISLAEDIEKHLQDGRKGQRLQSGVRTVIVGEPNVGKSSLLNFLVGRSAAIVSPIAGTTRDVVEVPINVAGYPLLVADTAGQRKTPSDSIEQDGIERARKWTKTADLAILVLDAQNVTKNSWSEYVLARRKRFEIQADCEILVVINKMDLITNADIISLQEKEGVICVSCTTQKGLDQLLEKLQAMLTELCGNPTKECPSLTQERHRHHLTHCLRNVNHAIDLSVSEENAALAANSLRKAMRNLGTITGHIKTDEILDVIFRDFCVGK